MISLETILQSLVSGIVLGGIYAFLGAGVSLSYGVMGVGNFAHGAIAFLAGYLAYSFLRIWGIDPLLSMVVLLPLFFLVGLVIYRAMIFPAYIRISQREFGTAALLLTFGLSLMLQSLMSYFWGTLHVTITRSYFGRVSFAIGPLYFSTNGIISLILAVASIMLLAEFLERTYTGLAIRATSQNREVASMMAINIQNIWLISFGITTALACMAGVAVSLMYPFYPYGNVLWCIKGFIVVVLGGLGSVRGTVVGGLLLGICESVGSTLLPFAFRDVIALSIFIVVLLVRPHGIFGRR